MSNRDLDALRTYHDRTKHSVASVHRDPHTLDWAIMPHPFKVYPEIAAAPLPRDFTSSSRPVLTTLADPGTRTRGDTPLDRTALARILYFSAGVLRHKTYPGGEIYLRAAACTGALYHIDLYLVGGLPDLEAGVYHFGPHDFALRRLRPGDHRGAVVDATAGEAAVAAAPVIIALTSTFWRNAWKYRARTYRHCFWDAGTLVANLLAAAAAVDLPARVVLGFVDDALNGLLDLDPRREVTLALIALGTGASPPPPAPPAGPLGLETLPLSAREIDYPAIREAHVASSLSTARKVVAWRGTLVRPAEAPGSSASVSLAVPDLGGAAPEPVEAVILRRGSTRVFAPAAIGLEQLSTVLWCATRGIVGDCFAPDAVLTDPYLIVHAVDGLEPGAYVYDRERHALDLVRAGGFRRQAGHLGLGQALAAEAAVDVFWLTDLAAVLERFGNRGYRAAQLEAAIEGGKTYLAAFALRLGATGLTFYDDDVIDFFSPGAAGRSVMFLMAVGHPARRR